MGIGPLPDDISGMVHGEGDWEFFNTGRLPRWHTHRLRDVRSAKKRMKIKLNMVSRAEWGALPNKDEAPVDMPVTFVRYIQTDTPQCTSREECVKLMQELQTKHMAEGMADIQYNFLISTDGTVYEGRGWAFDASRDIDFYFLVQDGYDVAYIGQFNEIGDNIPEAMTSAATMLADYGVFRKYIDCCYRQVPFNTESNPGVIKVKHNH